MAFIRLEHQNNRFRPLFKFEILIEIDDVVIAEFDFTKRTITVPVKPGRHKIRVRDKHGSLAKSNFLFIQIPPLRVLPVYSRMKGVFNITSKKIRCASWQLSLEPISPLSSDIVPIIRSKLK